jgi:hypothetical protein
MPAARRALVIGNAGYAGEDMQLQNPVGDAEAVTSKLSSLGFQVSHHHGLTFDKMTKAIAAFAAALKSSPVNVGLFYFSGHGVQIQDQNFIVPIDFDRQSDSKESYLIKVKQVIDDISAYSNARLIFLDCCRTSPKTQSIIGTRGLHTEKAIFVGGQAVTGLAEMDADRNTFIAFATASGKGATDGSGALSPFTQALVSNLDAVDLPLFNLMARVRQKVFKETQGAQRTWDQSSLDAPFFFNPGSLLLFLGNIMALVGLILAFVPYSLLLVSGDATLVRLICATALPLISLGVLMFGMQSAYSRLRGNFELREDHDWTLRDHLLLSLQKGGIGGYLGALLCAPWISFPYMWGWEEAYRSGQRVKPPESIGILTLDITVAAAIVACLLGTLSILSTRIEVTGQGLALLPSRTWHRTVLASAAGGILAGMIAAPLLTAYFGRLNRPEVTPDYLLPGSMIGAALLIFAIVNFDFERLNVRRIGASAVAAVASLLCGVSAALIVFGPLYLLGVVDAVRAWLAKGFNGPEIIDWGVVISGGVAYGVPVGLVLGVVIGAAVILTEWWSAKPVI